MGALASRTVASKPRMSDALLARPEDCIRILRSAGGRVGVRFSVYMLMGMGASSVVANFMEGDLPLEVALVAAPLAAMTGLTVLPLLIPGYAGGLLVGHIMGARLAASKAGHAIVLRDSSTGAMRLLLSSMALVSLATLWHPNVQGWRLGDALGENVDGHLIHDGSKGFWLGENVDGQGRIRTRTHWSWHAEQHFGSRPEDQDGRKVGRGPTRQEFFDQK
jgi:hypothetical protein